MISQKMIELTPLQKLSKNLGKFLLPKALKSCPKSNKSPNLVTLIVGQLTNLRQNAATASIRRYCPRHFVFLK